MTAAKEQLGGCCKKCGSIINLELDHIDPKTKSFTIGKLWSVSKDAFWKEVEKCQLLCKTCHDFKEYNGSRKRRYA